MRRRVYLERDAYQSLRTTKGKIRKVLNLTTEVRIHISKLWSTSPTLNETLTINRAGERNNRAGERNVKKLKASRPDCITLSGQRGCAKPPQIGWYSRIIFGNLIITRTNGEGRGQYFSIYHNNHLEKRFPKMTS